MATKDYTYRVEFTVAGSRESKLARMVVARGPKAALATFREQTADRTGVEVVDMWRHEGKGSTEVIRKNTVTLL